MRIVDKKEFLTLPEGTVYSGYQPCVFDGLFIKGETWDNDFLENNLIAELDCSGSDERFDILSKVENTGESFKLDFDCYGREGLFDDEMKYAVYEKEDVEGLIKTLQESLKAY